MSSVGRKGVELCLHFISSLNVLQCKSNTKACVRKFLYTFLIEVPTTYPTNNTENYIKLKHEGSNKIMQK